MFERRITLGLVTVLANIVGIVHADELTVAQNTSLATYRKDVQPLLRQFCADCHGRLKQESNIRFDKLDPDMAKGSDGETWHDALNKLNLGDMPPQDAPQPNAKQRDILVDWITSELKRAYHARRSTGGRVVLRRLTRYEYANTLRDLLGLDLNFAEDLPAEPNSPDGLKNNGSSLAMTPQQIEAYVDVARMAIAKAIVTTDKPKVFKFDGGKVGSGRGPLFPPNVGMSTFADYPIEGEFRILVQASVSQSTTNDDDNASLRVVMGVRPSPKNLKTKDVGVVKVTASKDEPQTFEFRGRMENFPLHDPVTAYRERRYPQLQVGFWNMTYDQAIAQNQKRKKKKKRNKEPDTQPVKPAAGPTITVHSVSFEAPIFDSWPPRHHR